MDNVYVFLNGSEWEDAIVFLSKEDAIQESIKHPKHRVEIFGKKGLGYHPTYHYYKNGELVNNS